MKSPKAIQDIRKLEYRETNKVFLKESIWNCLSEDRHDTVPEYMENPHIKEYVAKLEFASKVQVDFSERSNAEEMRIRNMVLRESFRNELYGPIEDALIGVMIILKRSDSFTTHNLEAIAKIRDILEALQVN